MVGVAVTAADEKPFHAMAAKKVPGAGKAIWLLRNADKVASFCNDVVGDICGIISGAASAVIAGQIIAEIAQTGRGNVVQLAMSGLVAGMTVGGKAAGKSIAMQVQHKHRLSDGARAGAVLPEKEINAACAADDRFIRKSLCRY